MQNETHFRKRIFQENKALLKMQSLLVLLYEKMKFKSFLDSVRMSSTKIRRPDLVLIKKKKRNQVETID